MIFLVSLEVCNRFRSVFIDEDVNDYREALEENLAKEMEVSTQPVSRTQNRKAAKEIVDLTARYKQQNEKLTNDLQKLTHGYFSGFDEVTLKKVMGIVDIQYLLTMELNKSKNPKQMLAACQLYNAGVFDKAMEEVYKMQKEKLGISVPQGLVDIHGNKL